MPASPSTPWAWTSRSHRPGLRPGRCAPALRHRAQARPTHTGTPRGMADFDRAPGHVHGGSGGAAVRCRRRGFGAARGTGVAQLRGDRFRVSLCRARRALGARGGPRASIPFRPGPSAHPPGGQTDRRRARARGGPRNGTVGRSAYDRSRYEYGLTAVGIETLVSRAEHLRSRGYDVIEGDATDPDVWTRLRKADVQIAVLAMPFHGNTWTLCRSCRTADSVGPWPSSRSTTPS